MPGGAINITIGGNAQQLTQAAGQAANALNGFAGAANAAGTAADHAFDEIAAGSAAMARIEAAIEAAAAAARNAGTALQLIGSNAITSITPLNTLEARLNDIRDAIGRSATVQGAANLGAQYEVINRNLEQTRNQIAAATTAAIGLGNAFNSIAGAGASLNRLSPAIRPVLTDLRLIPPAANAAAASLARVRGSAGPAGAALTDFSRIVQDAPFGIIGIGNNITQLADSFGRLRATAGSTGGAFRQLFSSAGGFGGIGLAISLITTALTFASVGFGAWTRGLTGAKKAADDAAKAAEEFTTNLKSVSDIAGQAGGSVQGQIANVQALASVITNTNAAYEDRKRALQELQQINKNYFGDLSLEENRLGTLTARVEEYTQALVSQAVVKGFESEISKVSTGLFEQEKVLKRTELAYKRLRDELSQTKQTSTSATGEERLTQRYVTLSKEVENARGVFEKQRDVVEQGRSSFVDLQGAMQRAVVASLKFRDTSSSSADASEKDTDLLKQRIAALKELQGLTGLDRAQQVQLAQLEIQLANRDSIKAGFTADELQQQIDGILEKAFPVKTFEFKLDKIILEPRTVEISPIVNVSGATIPSGISDGAFDGVIDAIKNNAAIKFAELQRNLSDNIQSAILQGAVEGIIAVGNTLGEAIAGIFNGEGVGNALAAGAENLLSIVGGVLQQVGKEIIFASKLVAALKAAIRGLFGPGGEAIGVGVGIALVTAGAILKSIKFGSSTPGFADGVTNFTGGQALVGERGPELVTLPAGSNVIPRDPFSVQIPAPSLFARGDDLYLSYNRTASRRRRI